MRKGVWDFLEIPEDFYFCVYVPFSWTVSDCVEVVRIEKFFRQAARDGFGKRENAGSEICKKGI